MWKQALFLRTLGKCIPENINATLDSLKYNNNNFQQVRYIKKHWDPKFRKLRREKVSQVPKDYIDEYQNRFSDELTPEQRRAKMLKRNIPLNSNVPPVNTFMSSTNFIWNPYRPKAGDGKFSITAAAKSKLLNAKDTANTLISLRRIRVADVTFDKKKFPEEALQIYIKANECLVNGNKEDLIGYVSTGVYKVMVHNTDKKTIRWKLLSVLDPPNIVQAAVMKDKSTGHYGQITVRLHTEQQLAVYDRFGRLMQGSEILRKDVLEYVVFEKCFDQMNPIWRIVGKIKSDSKTPAEPVEKTYIQSSVKSEYNSGETSQVAEVN